MFEIIPANDALVEVFFMATLAVLLFFGSRTIRGTQATWRDVHRTDLLYNRYHT